MNRSGLRTARLVLFMTGLCAVSSVFAQTLPDDQNLSRLLVGYWAADNTSPDLRLVNPPTAYVLGYFGKDGHAEAYVYSDKTCRTLLRSVTTTWWIEHGTLYARYPGGGVGQDQILSMSNNRIVMRVGSGPLEIRTRSDDCRAGS